MRDGGRYGDQRDGKTPGQSVHFRLPTHHPFVPTRIHVAGGEHRTARQRPSGRLRRPGHALLPRLAHPRQGRPHPIPGHRRPTAPHLPVNHRLRAARTGRRPRPHRQPQRPHFGTRRQTPRHQSRATTHPARTRHRLLPHVRAGRRFGRPVRSEGQRHRLARATQHRRQHPPHIRPARRHGRQRPPPIRLIPGQRRHPRHRHHRRPRRRAPHLRRDEHARRATDRIRRVQSENHRGNIPRRA